MHLHGSSQQKIPLRALPTEPLPVTGIRHWAAEYIGKRHQIGARGPDAYDCWGLLREIYQSKFGISLPYLPGITAGSISEICKEIKRAMDEEEWSVSLHPFDGCAVAMSQMTVYHHVGVYIQADGGKILHCWDGQNVIADTIRRLKLKGMRKITYFRHRLWPSS